MIKLVDIDTGVDVALLAPVISEAALLFCVSYAGIMGPKRTGSIMAARRYCVFEARDRFGWSWQEISSVFGVGDKGTTIRMYQAEERRRAAVQIAAE